MLILEAPQSVKYPNFKEKSIEHRSQITRSTGVVSATTMGSRILGFFRDILLASLFPASVVDAFIVAFRIPNALRRFVSEGAFSISVIPVYSKCSTENQQKQLINALFTFLVGALSLATLILIIFAPQLLKLYAPGFATPQQGPEVVQMLRIMLPYLAFLSLVALAMGVLNSHQRFFSPAAAPVLLNICFISAMLFQSHYSPENMLWIAWGVVFSGLLQCLFQVPFLKKIGRLPQFTKTIWTADFQRVVKLWLPAMWSVSIIQLTTLVGTRFASLLPPGTVTGLYLSERIVELPLGVFAVAIGTASLPVLSRLVKNNIKEFNETVNHSLILSELMAIPAAVGIFVLSEHIVRAFYFRRSFEPQTMKITIECLQLYALAVPFGAILRTFAAAYHAFERMKIPALIATLVLLIYIGFCTWSYQIFQHRGLALGSSISVMINGIALLVIFHFFVHRLNFMPIFKALFKICIAAGVMGFIIYYLSQNYFPVATLDSELKKWSSLFFLCFVGMAVYAILIVGFRVSEGEVVWNKIKNKF